MDRPILCALLLLVGCNAFSHRNEPLDSGQPTGHSKASFDVREPRGAEDVMVILALSGGGSRAAYFSASTMLALDELGLLEEVDAISAVSGGALPGAYYCISRDPVPEPSVTLEEGLPGRLPKDVAAKVTYDDETRQLTARSELTDADRDQLASRCFVDVDRQKVARLHRLSQPVPSNRMWTPDEVRDLMTRNYIARWNGNICWPTSWLRCWLTAYDTSDVMAQTFADNLYDVSVTGRDLTFADLNPERPYLVLNATNATESHDGEVHFGQVFTFTEEDFREILAAEIESFPVAWGVMASSAFPAAFATMTLADYDAPGSDPRFVHLIDGGSTDNLGLSSAKRIIFEAESRPPEERPRAYVVICVDAYVQSGVGSDDADPRSGIDHIVDTNFLVAVDSLLASNRARSLDEFRNGRLFIHTDENTRERHYQRDVEQRLLSDEEVEELIAKNADQVRLQPDERIVLELDNLMFWHIQFDDIEDLDTLAEREKLELLQELNGIATNFAFDDVSEQTAAIDRTVKLIVTQDLDDVGRIKAIVEGGDE